MALIEGFKQLSGMMKKNPLLKDLSDEEKDVFIVKAKELISQERLDSSVLETLAIYSTLIVQLRSVNKEIAQTGLTQDFIDRYGHSRKCANPLFKVKKELLSDIRRTGRLFEFSPRDAKEISGKSQEGEDGFTKFMKEMESEKEL